MAFQATAWILAFATLVGPSLCCCTTASFASSISRLLGGDAVVCVSSQCCHVQAEHRGHAEASHRGHHHHDHGDADAASIAKRTDRSQDQSPPRRECPCKQHRTEVVALPAGLETAAGASAGHFDLIWVTIALPVAAAPSQSAHPALPSFADGTCRTGREILRAHCILRI